VWKLLLLKIIGCILLVLLLILIVILFTKVKVDLTYKFEPKDQRLIILIRALFGMIRFRIEIPKLKEKPKKGKKTEKTISFDGNSKKNGEQLSEEETALESFDGIKQLMERVKDLHEIVKDFLRKVRISHFEWKSALGTGNAASTGTVAGLAWAFKGSMIGIISDYFSLRVSPKLDITPVFNRAISNTYIKCMIQVRTGNAILAGLKILKYWRKNISAKQTKKEVNVGNKSEDQPV
jgi:uncharacterized integral membrane protein